MFPSNTLPRLWPSSDSNPSSSRTTPSRAAADAPRHLPPIAIEEQSSRAPQLGSGIASLESRDRTERRVATASQSNSRADRSISEVAGRGRNFDPPLDRDSSLGSQGSNNTELPGPAHLLNNTPMLQRIETFPVSSPHGREHNSRVGYIPSPPPIATLSHTHSPSLSVSSLDHSSTSPHPLRRPPPSRSPLEHYPDSYHSHEPSSHRHSPGSHFQPSPRSTHAFPYPTRTYDHRFNSGDSMGPQYQMTGSYQPYPTVPSMMGTTGPSIRDNGMYQMPGHNLMPIVHTDDATTKLSDRVRRRCFNCCTTDTSTWRRSNLSPGKVLCNKCGLFERTHSRPRPDQFSHRRGSMPTASDPAQSRTPPGSLPPIHNQMPSLAPPHHYDHPSIAPLANVPDSRRSRNPNSLPEIQSWANSPRISSSQLPSGSRYQEQPSPRPHHSPPTTRLQHEHEDSHTTPSSHG